MHGTTFKKLGVSLALIASLGLSGSTYLAQANASESESANVEASQSDNDHIGKQSFGGLTITIPDVYTCTAYDTSEHGIKATYESEKSIFHLIYTNFEEADSDTARLLVSNTEAVSVVLTSFCEKNFNDAVDGYELKQLSNGAYMGLYTMTYNDTDIPILLEGAIDANGNFLILYGTMTSDGGATDELSPTYASLSGVYSSNSSSPSTSSQDSTDSSNLVTGSTATRGEQNALASAQKYLKRLSFSRSGLIDQLEYEGFTTSEAEYAVDNCKADWNEQAVLKAKSYLKRLSFSRSGLIDQLEYEGFTTSEAEYAVDCCGADWDEQAILKAQSYLKHRSFSRNRLIEQLEYEGFTNDQASTAATAVGL